MMKVIRTFLLCSGCLVVGFGLGAWRVTNAPAESAAENSVEVAAGRETAAAGQPAEDPGFWKEEAERLRKTAEEAPALRGEVARLKRELAQAMQRQVEALQMAAKSNRGEAPKEMKNDWRMLSLNEAPPMIQAAIQREVGGAEIKGMAAHWVNGKLQYSLKGKFEDDRFFALNLAEDGTLLERHLQLPIETLPAEITSLVQEKFAGVKIGGASHVLKGERQYYEISGKSPERGIEIQVRPDGTIQAYSSKLYIPEENKAAK